MADPQTNWIEYQPGRRYDPTTGQAQWFRNGNWQDIGTIQYDQHTGGITLGGQPVDLRVNTFGGGGSNLFPSLEQFRQFAVMQQIAAAGGGAGAAGATSGAPSQTQGMPSYWGAAPQINTQGAWQSGGGAQAAGYGGGGAQTGGSAQTGGGGSSMATATQIPWGVRLPDWQTWYGQNLGKTIMVNGQPRTIGQDIGADETLQAYRNQTIGWGAPPVSGPQQPATQIGGGPDNVQPETRALGQMAQIDPASEALRQGLGASYLANLGGGPPPPQFGGFNAQLNLPQFNLPSIDLSRGAAAPAAGDVQSYLDLYKQIDPQGYAQRVAMAGGMDQFVQQAQARAALGSQLDPGTIREVEQGTRAAQIARGNVYGTPQLVAETMARGTAGEQRNIQRQQMLASALGQQQSYLGAGIGIGDVANALYQQGYGRYMQGYGQALSGYQAQAGTALNAYQAQNNAQLAAYQQRLNAWQAQQNARLQSQGAALGYLGSGQTPYQAGASYLGSAEQRAGMAAQGGPQYNPASLGQQYTGAGAPSFPQYGLDISQLAGNWYNNINQANLQAYGLGQAYGGASGGQRAMGAGVGALGGAASGALAGAAAGGIGAIPGAIIGGIGGAASGYFK